MKEERKCKVVIDFFVYLKINVKIIVRCFIFFYLSNNSIKRIFNISYKFLKIRGIYM